jgi:tetratricopeptide (TPR) repeat protein
MDARLQEALAEMEKGRDAQAVILFRKLLDEGTLDAASSREARIALGTSLYRLGRFDQSLQALSPLTGAKPPDSGALLLSAWDLHRMGQDAKAYEALRKAAPLNGWKQASAMVPVRLADVEREPEVVLAGAQEVLSETPDGPWAVRPLILSARAYERLGDAASALKSLEKALPQMPDGKEQYEEALHAARIAWEGVHDPRRASRWFALAAQSAPDDASRAKVKLAEAYMDWQRGETTGALQGLADVTKLYPNTPSMPEAYLLLGRMQATEGDRERALESFKVVTGSFRNSPAYQESVLEQAELLWTAGRAQEAASLLKGIEGRALPPAMEIRRLRLQAQLSLSKGECAKASALLAQAEALRAGSGELDLFATLACSIRAGRIQEALGSAETMKDPALVRALRFRAAEALEAAGKGDAARALWEELVDEGGPDGALALWCLADGQLAAGREAEGTASLKKLSATPGGEPLALLAQYRLERNSLDRKDPASALASIPAFRRAEPPRPGEAEALLSDAREKMRSGNSAGARELYQAYLDRFPDKAGAHEASLAMARDAAARGDWATARQILEKMPASPARDLLLGRAHFSLGEPEAAQLAEERALASPLDLGPSGVSQASLIAAQAAVIRGRTADATKHYATYALSVTPTKTDKEVLLDAGLFLQAQGEYDAALEAFEKLLKISKDPAVPFQYAYTLELSGRKEEALKAFLKAAKSPSPMWAPTARYRAAELYADLGKLPEAIAIYRDMAGSAKGTVQGEFAKQRLQELQDELAESKPAPKKGAVENPAAKAPPQKATPQKTSPQKATPQKAPSKGKTAAAKKTPDAKTAGKPAQKPADKPKDKP